MNPRLLPAVIEELILICACVCVCVYLCTLVIVLIDSQILMHLNLNVLIGVAAAVITRWSSVNSFSCFLPDAYKSTH